MNLKHFIKLKTYNYRILGLLNFSTHKNLNTASFCNHLNLLFFLKINSQQNMDAALHDQHLFDVLDDKLKASEANLFLLN